MVKLFKKIVSTITPFIKKIILILVVYAVVANILFYFINQNKLNLSVVKNDLPNPTYELINDPELNSTDNGKLTIFLYKGIVCSFIGEACTDNPADDQKNYQSSISGQITNLISTSYSNPPASGILWAQN
ncbi:MAG TPA: hypothetical protein PLS49_03895, partial [Candidatus Woesebacteria bacterium]|nr:hypothetical protein [Candidatus Woesebacteria bacterium]